MAHVREIQRLRFENYQLEREMETQRGYLILSDEEGSWNEQQLCQWNNSLPNDAFIANDAFETDDFGIFDALSTGHCLKKKDVKEGIVVKSCQKNQNFLLEKGSHSDMQQLSYSNDNEEFVDVETLFD